MRVKMRQWFGEYYHDADLADRVAVFGTVEQVIEELSGVVEENLNMLMLNPCTIPTSTPISWLKRCCQSCRGPD